MPEPGEKDGGSPSELSGPWGQEGGRLLRVHYGWYVVGVGMLVIMASLGLGRFALGMLLPAMGEALALSYGQMGMIGTCNFGGYLVAVLVSGPLAARLGSRRLIFYALVLVGLTMLLISQADHYWGVLIFYTLTGLGSGASNVPMMGLVSAWFVSRQRGRAAGFIVIGSGFAILLAGRYIPLINQAAGAAGWRYSWLILASIVLAVAFLSAAVLRNRPAELGLEPVGAAEPDRSGSPASAWEPPDCRRQIYHLGLIYFLFGFTYVIYATFVVTYLIEERGFSEQAAGGFWAWVGVLSLLSGPVFGTLSDKIGRGTALVLVFSIQSVAYLLLAWELPLLTLPLSIFCYGIVAWSIPTIMAALVGDYVGSQRAARAFGFITFLFGWGQISGPALAGYLGQITGSFGGSFLMAAVLAALAALLSARLQPPARRL